MKPYTRLFVSLYDAVKHAVNERGKNGKRLFIIEAPSDDPMDWKFVVSNNEAVRSNERIVAVFQ